MKGKIKKISKILLFVVLGVIGAGVIFYFVTWYGFRSERSDINWGVTFSPVMVRQLGLDVRGAYESTLFALGAKIIRIPVYWEEIEPEQGKYDFSDYDYFVSRAKNADAKLLLVMGRKLPRIPECHMPFWAYYLSEKDQEDAVLAMMKTVVERYRESPNISAWQVENEPFRAYGSDCAEDKISVGHIEKEVALVRSLDSRSVMLTDSGAQWWWFPSLKYADILGISMNFQSRNGVAKKPYFSFGPGFYAFKAKFFGWWYPQKKIIVSELEMEPRGFNFLPGLGMEGELRFIDQVEFRRRISYARRAGFETYYFEGVEWWYWLRTAKGSPDLWDQAGTLFKGQGK